MHDPCPFERWINDIPPKEIHQEVSGLLEIQYLSKYEESLDELERKRQSKEPLLETCIDFFKIPTSVNRNSQL
jgi:hypothetical protein